MNQVFNKARSICVPHVLGMENEDLAFSPSWKLLLETIEAERRKLDPHAGLFSTLKEAREGVNKLQSINENMTNVFSALAYSGSSVDQPYENLVSRLQDLSALIVVLSGCNSIAAFIAALVLYARTHYTGILGHESVCKLISYIKLQLFPERPEWEDLHLQSLDEHGLADYVSGGYGGNDTGGTLFRIKQALQSWKTARSSDLSKNISNVVSIMITLGFCPDLFADESKFSAFKLFSAQVWDIQNRPVDFLEMVLDTGLFFIENVLYGFQTGDWSTAFYSDKKMADLDRRYTFFMSTLPLLEANKIEQMLSSAEFGICDEYTFIYELEKVIAQFTDLMVVEKKGVLRGVLQSKCIALSKVRSAVVAAKRESTIREAPFCLLIYGPSSIGKTMMDLSIHKTLADANGFPSGKNSVVTLNGNDKYQSEFRAHHIGIRLDDLCNTNPQYVETSPVDQVIHICNNVPRAALKADVESKGNVMFNPKIVTATTNKKDLLAHLYATAPGAVMRRWNYILDGRLKPEFEDPETRGFDARKATGDLVPDYWIITLQRVRLIRRGSDEVDSYEFYDVMKDASFPQVLDFLQKESIEHFTMQKQYVKRVEEQLEMNLCEHSRDPVCCSKCAYDKITRQKMSEAGLGPDDLDSHMGEEDLKKAMEFLEIPHLEQNTYLHSLRNKSRDKDLAELIKDWEDQIGMNDARMNFEHLNVCLAQAWREHKASLLKGVLATSLLAGTIYGIIKLYRSVRESLEPLAEQGNSVRMPVPHEEKVNQWMKPVITSLPVSTASMSANIPDLCNLVSRSIAHLTVYVPDTGRRSKCNILPLFKDEWLMPFHMVHDGPFWVEVQSGPTGTVGHRNFRELIDPLAVQHIPNTDFCIIRLHKGGCNKDLVKFFLEDDFVLPRDMHANTIYRKENMDIEQNVVRILEKRNFTSKARVLPGLSYNYPNPTFFGQCIMTLISNTPNPAILGFHICGRTGTNYGVAGIVSARQIRHASEMLGVKYPLASHSSGTAVLSIFGKDVRTDSPINKHHAVNFLEEVDGREPQLTILGAHGLGTARFKSNVRKSPISDSVERILNWPRKHGPPDGKCINQHFQRDLQTMAIPKGDIAPRVLHRAKECYWSRIRSFLDVTPEARDMVHVVPLEVALAGADNIAFMEGLNLQTSTGFPLNCPKNRFLKRDRPPIPGISSPISIHDLPLEEELERIYDILASNERCYFVHRANLKDEPTKFGKNKIRVFSGCQLLMVVAYRQIFMSVMRLMHRYPQVFETGVGMNAAGPEWDASVRYISQFCKNDDRSDLNGIAGDFSSFDKTLPCCITMAAFDIQIRVMEYCGYSERHLAIARGLATECCHPLYEYNGVFLITDGSSPSGFPGTVDINGMGVSILLRCPYYEIYADDPSRDFNKDVALLDVGDDHTAGVDSSAPEFNMQTICEKLAGYGMGYTLADKTPVTKPYYAFHEMSFLKRGYRFDEQLGMYMAPLEKDSIGKSLHNYMHSKNALKTPGEISVDALMGALREMFQYGESEYNEFREKIPLIASDAGLLQFLPELPTFQDMVRVYFGQDSDTVSEISDEVLDCHCDDTMELIEMYVTEVSTAIYREKTEYWSPKMLFANRVLDGCSRVRAWMCRHKCTLMFLAFAIYCRLNGPFQVSEDGLFVKMIVAIFNFIDQCNGFPVAQAVHFQPLKNIKVQTNGLFFDYSDTLVRSVPRRVYEHSVFTEPAVPRLGTTIESLLGLRVIRENRPANNNKCQDSTQSKNQPNQGGCSLVSTVRRDVPHFVAQPVLPPVLEIEDPTEGELDPHAGEANEHGDCTEDVSTMQTQQIVSFADSNPSYVSCVESTYDAVRQMVDNNDADLSNFFKRPIRIADLQWSIGTPFFWQLSPWTLYFSNTRVKNRMANYNQVRCKLHLKFLINGNPFYYGRIIVAYQPLPLVDQCTLTRNGVNEDIVEASQRPHVFLDPSDSQGAEMVLPFVYHLNNASVPGNQLYELGDIHLISLSDLKHANAGTDPLRITVWAWAEDVHLSIPTSRDPFDLSPQSFDEYLDPHVNDEYGNGVISTPASTLARWAGKLKMYPSIAPYARATEIGASAVSQIATLFGYSKPTIVTDRNFVNIGVGNMANTSGGDTSIKLSLDPKQELSIDPRLTGLGDADEMLIRSIATRESYLTSFDYKTSQTPDALCWNCAVTPTLWREATNPAGQKEYHLTAMCFATLPFKYWRGNINYRFMVASSGMHKGRLRFVYEPNNIESLEFNINYQAVVDIAESRDFTISVGWGQTPAILNHTNPFDMSGITYFSQSGLIPDTVRDDRNGVLNVYVSNSLTSPNSTVNNDVRVHVFVSAGDNFEVFVPEERTLINASWFPEPSVGFAGKSEQLLEAAPIIEDSDAAFPVSLVKEVVDEVLDPHSAYYDGTKEPGKTEQDLVMLELGPKVSLDDPLTAVHIGEEITSIRNHLKRYIYNRGIALAALTGATPTNFYVKQTQSNFPNYGGWAPAPLAVHSTSTGFPYNYFRMTLLNYYTPAFICRRGGVRWKFQKSTPSTAVLPFTVTRLGPDEGLTDSYTTFTHTLTPAATWASYAAKGSEASNNRVAAMSTLLGGGQITYVPTNGILEVELPYYSNNRFAPGKYLDQNNTIIDKGRDTNYHTLTTAESRGSNQPMGYIDCYVAAGEDFSLSFFCGAPILYKYVPPTGAS